MTVTPRDATSTTPRLSRGDIPASWAQPAEVVSQAPTPAAQPLGATGIVLGGIAVCVVLAIALAARQPRAPAPPAGPTTTTTATTTQPQTPPPPSAAAPTAANPATPTAPVGTPRPIDDVPEPTPTASSIPTGVAPEDQGGAERPVVASAAPGPPATPGAATDAAVGELPARKKARGWVARAEKLLLDGDAAGAEPLLRRAAALDPTYPDAWRNLGIARATLGNARGARLAYKQYLKLAPTAPDAADVRKILAAPPAPSTTPPAEAPSPAAPTP